MHCYFITAKMQQCKLKTKFNFLVCFDFSSVRFLSVQTNFRLNDEQFIELSIFSFAPKQLTFKNLQISLQYSTKIDENVTTQLVNLNQDFSNVS